MKAGAAAGLVALVALFAAGPGCTLRPNDQTAQSASPIAAGGGRVMRIEFVRSGGPAAFPGMVMDATVDFAANPGRVSEKGGYTRDLASQEAQDVQKLIDPTLFFRINNKDLAKKRESGPRDLYQYDIAVHMDDGRTHSITVSDMMGETLEGISPGLGKFLDWAKQECQRITNYKVGQR